MNLIPLFSVNANMTAIYCEISWTEAEIIKIPEQDIN